MSLSFFGHDRFLIVGEGTHRDPINIACDYVRGVAVFEASVKRWNRNVSVFLDILQSCCFIENPLDPQPGNMDGPFERAYLPFAWTKRTLDESPIHAIVLSLCRNGETMLLF